MNARFKSRVEAAAEWLMGDDSAYEHNREAALRAAREMLTIGDQIEARFEAAFQPKTEERKMSGQWARWCYKSEHSKWPDGYARGHWVPAEVAKEFVAACVARGEDARLEYP